MQDEADPSVEENASKDLVLRQIHYYKECKKELVNYKKFHKVNNKGRENLEVVELDQIIGSGANANVKIGTNLKTGATYAIKIYDKYKLQEQK